MNPMVLFLKWGINYKGIFILCFFLLNIINCGSVIGQAPGDVDPEIADHKTHLAPVKVDGKTLFYVRGVSSYPAEERAATISKRIRMLASDKIIPEDSVKVVPYADRVAIMAGDRLIMNIYEIDAQAEALSTSVLAMLIKIKTQSTIRDYRLERSRPVLIRKSLHALGASALLAVILLVFSFSIRRINKILETRIREKLDIVDHKSFNLIRSAQLWRAFHLVFKGLKIMILVITIAVFVQYILGLFPWTNSIAIYVLELFTKPVIAMGSAIINYLPSLAFLFVIFLVTRYLLKLVRLLFVGIDQGAIELKNFKSDWAMPTFKIIRIFVVAFAIIVAYPYIPGSDSSAFKGVSVFIGILFSLGSSSFLGNVIAGYSMTYRSAFKKGDRIKVDETDGYVEEQKLLVTRLRSVKNEEIIIPNSFLLNSNITNYSTKENEAGLILHTTVGIGYETPWRQVDAMLLLAADRTESLLKEPPPYVLKKSLGDFAITYEINAYCNNVARMNHIYSVLHENILDIFNENNVQIMTPAYEGDPEVPKVVPKEQWNTPLADA